MTAQNPDEAPEGVEDPRLASLDAQLKAAHRAEAARTGDTQGSSDSRRGVVMGQRVASTMLGYPVGGAVVGWLIDEWLGTHPWIMLVLMFMAFGAACLEAIRISKKRSD